MQRDLVEAEVLNSHELHSQRQEQAKQALEAVYSAIALLASLGHNYSLTAGEPAPHVEFPKMLYHPAHGECTVEGPAEEAELLGQGWSNSPDFSAPETQVAEEPLPVETDLDSSESQPEDDE